MAAADVGAVAAAGIKAPNTVSSATIEKPDRGPFAGPRFSLLSEVGALKTCLPSEYPDRLRVLLIQQVLEYAVNLTQGREPDIKIVGEVYDAARDFLQ